MKVLLLAVLAAAGAEWVHPQGLPEGHNGGFAERLTQPAGGKKPHILMLLFDDFGWADAGWHRNYTAPGGEHVPYTDEVQTPTLNALVHEGIELDRNYIYKYCSPTRSSLQSGRNPYHVNPLNLEPTVANASDPVSGFAAVPRNMTGIATKMAAAGYKTAAFGKWDAGMATPDHTPHGRGYQRAVTYFHHCNDYWSMDVNGCAAAPPPSPQPQPQLPCSDHKPKNFCLASSPTYHGIGTKSAADCCSHCAGDDACIAWAWGNNPTPGGNHSCNLKSAVVGNTQGNCTSSCKRNNCLPKSQPVTDLWAVGEAAAHGGAEGPARGLNNTCVAGQAPGGVDASKCQPGPFGDTWHGGYEDSLFEQRVLDTINRHDPNDPLFLFWAPHIVHSPLQVPQEFLDKFDFMASTDKDKHTRQLYHAMVNFADAAIANVTAAFKAKGMWDDLVIVFSTDNGGPIYNNGTAGANNYPLKGGKMNNWEGGIRGNGFISGGFLPAAARGTRYSGMTTAWDWYRTFSALAGVDATDHRAAAAGLPPIDSYDHSGLILGTASGNTPARVELPIGTEPRPSNLTNAPPCDSYTNHVYYGDPRMGGHDRAPPPPASGRCTTVSGLIVDEGEAGLWKLLTGDVQQAVYTGPHYPNQTTNEISNNFVGHCADGCLYELRADPLERHDLAADAAQADRIKRMRTKLMAYEATAFNPHRGPASPAACDAALHEHGGFWGPFMP